MGGEKRCYQDTVFNIVGNGVKDMILQMKDVAKSYGEVKALKAFTFAFSEGIYGLLGPNGAGKSTLMKIITQNIEMDEGELLFHGEPVRGQRKRFVSALGYMPQQQRLYDSFSGARFLYYMASLKGLSSKEADAQIPGLLEKVNLVEESHRRIDTYSGGMKQRLLIAQALLGNPEIVLMDEPTAGLDPKERIHIRNLISEVARKKAVIIATHVVPDVEYIAKEILLLNKGELVTTGAPGQLTESIVGHVVECVINEEKLGEFTRKYRVATVSPDGARVRVRIVCDNEYPDCSYEEVEPTLEDVYLYYFGDQ